MSRQYTKTVAKAILVDARLKGKIIFKYKSGWGRAIMIADPALEPELHDYQPHSGREIMHWSDNDYHRGKLLMEPISVKAAHTLIDENWPDRSIIGSGERESLMEEYGYE